MSKVETFGAGCPPARRGRLLAGLLPARPGFAADPAMKPDRPLLRLRIRAGGADSGQSGARPSLRRDASRAPGRRGPMATGPVTAILVASAVLVAHQALAVEPIHPVPPPPAADPRIVALGERLFHDPRLSRTGEISCASCHVLAEGGDDGEVISTGIDGEKGEINSPTVFNAGLYVAQFWDGRAETLDDQIDGPVQNPIEMGSMWPEVTDRLYGDAAIAAEFDALYPPDRDGDTITRDTIKRTIATFVRSLHTTGSRFDRWLAGDENALSARELEGYRWFKHYGCHSCHQGAAVGGNFFQVFGVLNDSQYFRERGNITKADRGRFNITGNRADMHAFKVPSLRMVVHTAPYLHDGSAKTLRDAVDAMFTHQLGRTAPDHHKEAIIDFLYTLAGTHPLGPPLPSREEASR